MMVFDTLALVTISFCTFQQTERQRRLGALNLIAHLPSLKTIQRWRSQNIASPDRSMPLKCARPHPRGRPSLRLAQSIEKLLRLNAAPLELNSEQTELNICIIRTPSTEIKRFVFLN